MTVKIYRDDNANAIFVEDANGAQFLNNLHAFMDDPSDTVFKIRDKSRNNLLLTNLTADTVVDQNSQTYGDTVINVCNALNAMFSVAGNGNGVAPTITSSTSVSLTTGQTLNYELVATGGVGYEWSNLPAGVTTVDGNLRKLVGGSDLSAGTYTITAKAINYFGVDTENITLTVSDPPFADTYSIKFSNQDYMGANASILDPILGRASNGSGSGDAWSISLWYKGSTEDQGQVIFYFGDNDTSNGGLIELRQTNHNSQKRLRLRYGSSNNYLQLTTPSGSITPGTWQHILVTYDGGTTGSSSGSMSSYYSRFSIYIDGTLQTTSNTHNNYGWSSGIDPDNFRLGRLVSGNSLRQAYIDELAVWDSDQSSNVSDIYNSGSTHDLTDLTDSPSHWWRMGDGDTFPTIQDNVGNAHFVMYNMTAADIVSDTP